MTGFFLLVILGSTESRVPAGFAPIAIGLALTLIHLISIPVDNTSVNPARSTGQALFVGGWALQQLWLFWAAPLGGGLLGGIIHRADIREKAELAFSGGRAPARPRVRFRYSNWRILSGDAVNRARQFADLREPVSAVTCFTGVI